MRRWAKNILCLFSLLIFSASMTLWVRSLSARDNLIYEEVWIAADQRPGQHQMVQWNVASSCGLAALDRTWWEDVGSERVIQYWSRRTYFDRASVLLKPGAGDRLNLQWGGTQIALWQAGSPNNLMTEARVVLPLWLCLPFGIPPIVWLRRARREGGRGFEVSPEKKLDHPQPSTAEKN